MARGSVEKRENKNGTVGYRVRVPLPPDPITGKPKWRTGTFPTRREADRMCRHWVTEIERGVLLAPETLTVGELLRRWLETVGGDMRAKTRYDYAYTIERYIVPCIGHLRADRIRTADVDAFIAGLRTEKSDRATTRQKCLQRLKQAYGWAVRTGILVRDPALHAQPVRSKPKEHTVWSVDDWKAFQREAGEYLTLFTVFTATGLRRGEVLGLRWQDFDPDGNTLRIRQTIASVGGVVHVQPPKTDAARRTVKVPVRVTELLREHRREQVKRRLHLGPAWRDHDLVFPGVFGEPLHPDAIKRILNRIISRSGVPRVTVHELRHTHATWQVLSGTALPVVSQRLGHTKVSTTMDIYSHLLKDSQDQAVDVIERLMFDDASREAR